MSPAEKRARFAAYHREWWQRNKKRILAQRRRAWRADLEGNRKRMREYMRAYRERKKFGGAVEARATRP